MAAPESPQEATSIAGGLGDTASLTGSGDALVNLGAMLAMGKQARVKNQSFVATNLVPGAIGAMKLGGGTASEAMALTMALTTALTQGMKDQTGAVSKSAAINLASEMDRIFGADKSPLEHIEAIQSNPAKAKLFWDGAKGKPGASIQVEAQAAVKELFAKGSEIDQLFRQNMQGYGDNQAMKSSASRWLADLGSDPGQLLANQDREQKMIVDQMQAGDLRGAQGGVNRQNIFEMMSASGAGFFESAGQQAMYNAQTLIGGVDPNVAMAERLRDRATTIRQGLGDTDRQLTATEQANVALLEKHIKALEANTKATEANTKSGQAKRRDVNINQHVE